MEAAVVSGRECGKPGEWSEAFRLECHMLDKRTTHASASLTYVGLADFLVGAWRRSARISVRLSALRPNSIPVDMVTDHTQTQITVEPLPILPHRRL
jgi:hypothetical protein